MALVVGVGSEAASAVEVVVGVAVQEVGDAAGVEGGPGARTGSVVLVNLFVLCQEGGAGGFLMGRGLSSPSLAPLLEKTVDRVGAMGDQSFVAPSLPSSQRRCHGAVDTL